MNAKRFTQEQILGIRNERRRPATSMRSAGPLEGLVAQAVLPIVKPEICRNVVF